MNVVFVDTSGFYAALDARDPDHGRAVALFRQASAEAWQLETTSYVLHETWALVQARLGWEALDVLIKRLFPMCRLAYVDVKLQELGAARCMQARSRWLSLTDCVSLAYMHERAIRSAIAFDEHFGREGVKCL